jgi:hypothetical protein
LKSLLSTRKSAPSPPRRARPTTAAPSGPFVSQVSASVETPSRRVSGARLGEERDREAREPREDRVDHGPALLVVERREHRDEHARGEGRPPRTEAKADQGGPEREERGAHDRGEAHRERGDLLRERPIGVSERDGRPEVEGRVVRVEAPVEPRVDDAPRRRHLAGHDRVPPLVLMEEAIAPRARDREREREQDGDEECRLRLQGGGSRRR